MNITSLKQQIAANTPVDFKEVIALIDANYAFTPTTFTNGDTTNAAGENNGSCKLFSFAKLHGFTKDETLACFGHFYFDHVLKHPEGTDHANIRNFMKYGWDGIRFQGEALKPF
jgi:hypothetical protein